MSNRAFAVRRAAVYRSYAMYGGVVPRPVSNGFATSHAVLAVRTEVVRVVGTVTVMNNTFKTIHFLCSEKSEDWRHRPQMPLAVPILAQTILDALYTCIFLFEDLPSRSTWDGATVGDKATQICRCSTLPRTSPPDLPERPSRSPRVGVPAGRPVALASRNKAPEAINMHPRSGRDRCIRQVRKDALPSSRLLRRRSLIQADARARARD